MPRTVREIIDQSDELARRFEEDFEPDPNASAAADSLAALHRAARAWAQASAVLAGAVAQARRDGNSWAAIGRHIGTTGEAARQRYGKAAPVPAPRQASSPRRTGR